MKNLLSHKISDWEIWLYRKLMWQPARAQQMRLYRTIYSGTGSSFLLRSLIRDWQTPSDPEKFFLQTLHDRNWLSFDFFFIDSRHTRLTFNRRLKELLICFSTRKQLNARRKTWNVNFFLLLSFHKAKQRGRRRRKKVSNSTVRLRFVALLSKSLGLF